MDQRLNFSYSATFPIRVAILDNGTGSLQHTLLPSLRISGFDAQSVASADKLYRIVITQPIEIVVLDTDLTNESGFEIAQHLRSISDVGIVMLMGRDKRRESIQALRSGADLYIAKPIDIELFTATLQSLSRRLNFAVTTGAVADRPVASGWRLQEDGWQLVSPGGSVVSLTAAEQRIIQTLAEKNGQLVMRETLIEAIAHNPYDFDPHRLEMVICRLRQKVAEQTGEKLPLKTVRGKGYLLTSSEY